MSVSQKFLSLTDLTRARQFLGVVGETAGAQHVERLLRGCAIVWVDAQRLSTEQAEQVWSALGDHLRNDYSSLLPYVFNHAVLSNAPSALNTVCAWCVSEPDTFTTVLRLLKNLQTFPVLPVDADAFCTPLLDLVDNPNHMETLVANLAHQVHANIDSYNSDVLNAVVDYAIKPLNTAKLLPHSLFSNITQWDTITSHYPTIAAKVIDCVSFEDALLFGLGFNYKEDSTQKWIDFLRDGVDPSPLDLADQGFPFTPAEHRSWLKFVDHLIPLYHKLGYATSLDHLEGMAVIAQNQEGLTVSTYQKQKIAAAVGHNTTVAAKISKI